MGQGEDFGDHPCGVCINRGREFVTTQYVMHGALTWVHKRYRYSGFSGKLKSS